MPKNAKISHKRRHLFLKVYLWLCAGFFVSGVTPLCIVFSPKLGGAILGNRYFLASLLGVPLVLFFVPARSLRRCSASLAILLFVLCCFATGLIVPIIFGLSGFSISATLKVFFIASATFGGMALFGYSTDRDLTSWGHILLFGISGLVLASLANLFFGKTIADWVITLLGVLVLTGLVGYHTEKIKAINISIKKEGSIKETREATIGALRLYLTFIFALLLVLDRFFGKTE